jgi:NADH dehydrogenase [ubiquinone] 1 alpha subcomplex assembly factor 7
MSELSAHIKAIVAEEGPISVERYIEIALTHPQHGYYMNRDPFGAAGDFTTAPEISQMFGELVGLWSAEVWNAMGKPDPVRLIELGPGRGTLMSDALRAARIVPEFRAAIDVTLVEVSQTLAEIQHETLLTAGAPIAWAASPSEAPEGPAIIIANEFLDALPVRQYVRSHNRWRERVVWVDKSGQLGFAPGRQPEPFIQAPGEEGDILEVNPASHRLVFELAGRLARQGGVALFVDYGHAITSIGDTLQAVRGHRIVNPLAEPGECDITAHVDFAAMARSARAAGAAVYGPIDQGDFLQEIGIDTRTRALAERTPERAQEFEDARKRLVGKDIGEMGALFKAMVVANRNLPVPPGFDAGVGR